MSASVSRYTHCWHVILALLNSLEQEALCGSAEAVLHAALHWSYLDEGLHIPTQVCKVKSLLFHYLSQQQLGGTPRGAFR